MFGPLNRSVDSVFKLQIVGKQLKKHENDESCDTYSDTQISVSDTPREDRFPEPFKVFNVGSEVFVGT